jgi:hypothetical protein
VIHPASVLRLATLLVVLNEDENIRAARRILPKQPGRGISPNCLAAALNYEERQKHPNHERDGYQRNIAVVAAFQLVEIPPAGYALLCFVVLRYGPTVWTLDSHRHMALSPIAGHYNRPRYLSDRSIDLSRGSQYTPWKD